MRHSHAGGADPRPVIDAPADGNGGGASTKTKNRTRRCRGKATTRKAARVARWMILAYGILPAAACCSWPPRATVKWVDGTARDAEGGQCPVRAGSDRQHRGDAVLRPIPSSRICRRPVIG